jgi:hypothetical protein
VSVLLCYFSSWKIVCLSFARWGHLLSVTFGSSQKVSFRNAPCKAGSRTLSIYTQESGCQEMVPKGVLSSKWQFLDYVSSLPSYSGCKSKSQKFSKTRSDLGKSLFDLRLCTFVPAYGEDLAISAYQTWGFLRPASPC